RRPHNQDYDAQRHAEDRKPRPGYDRSLTSFFVNCGRRRAVVIAATIVERRSTYSESIRDGDLARDQPGLLGEHSETLAQAALLGLGRLHLDSSTWGRDALRGELGGDSRP